MRYAIHIDSFSGALGDLPRKAHTSAGAVIACLRDNPRFSVFDIATPELARTMDRLKDSGRLRYHDGIGYPWCVVDVLPDAPTPTEDPKDE
jgi:hypothetical protein